MPVSPDTKTGVKLHHAETGREFTYVGTNVDGRVVGVSVSPSEEYPTLVHGKPEDFSIVESGVSENFAQRVRDFMVVSGQTSGRLNVNQVGLYIGLILEEVREMVSVITDATPDKASSLRLKSLESLLQQFSIEFREGLYYGAIMRCEHVALLDGFIDTSVVSHGATASLSPDPAGAENAVLSANEAKLHNGEVRKTPDGKWIKPEGWKPADLTPFVAEVDRDKD